MIASLPGAVEAKLSPAEFRAVAEMLRGEARISLSEAKVNLVQSRLARRLRAHGLTEFEPYLRLVRQDHAERAEMVTALTTNHTHFFRENHHFEHFRGDVLPRLREAAERGSPVRLWSAGCSSGEEIYSLAMVLAGERRGEAAWLRGDVRLLATDISEPMVEAVRCATYSAVAVDQVPLAYRAAWLKEVEGGQVRVAEELARLVTARALNLFAPWPFARRFDAIFCRNVMIYFDADARADLERRLVAQLKPGGWLYIGHSERLTGEAAEATVSCGQTIYRKREDA